MSNVESLPSERNMGICLSLDQALISLSKEKFNTVEQLREALVRDNNNDFKDADYSPAVMATQEQLGNLKSEDIYREVIINGKKARVKFTIMDYSSLGISIKIIQNIQEL